MWKVRSTAPGGSSVSEKTREEQDEVLEETTNTLGWFLAGAVIGAAVAILYAPKSGKETRQFIADTTQKSRDAVVDSSQNVMDASREMFERGRKLVEDAADLFDRGRKLMRG
jgi:gas vesicle protein